MRTSNVEHRTSNVEVTTDNRLQTHCCFCRYPMRIGRSLSMQMGMNSGHVTCPKCESFLHVEQLEGNTASTELFDEYVKRQSL
jgi:hypothetical protein